MNDFEYKILLGQNIKRIRKRAKMTQDAFSERIGIEPSSLSNIENGKSFPSALTIIQIYQQFNVNPQEIFDTQYLKSVQDIEKELFEKIKILDNDKKCTLWRIVKALDF